MERRDRDALAASLRRQLLQFGHPTLDSRVRVWCPFVPVFEHALEHPWPLAAHEHRNMWLLRRLRPLPNRIEIDEPAMEGGFLLSPDALHRQHALAHHLPARGGIDAVVAHLLAVPAGADAKQEAAAGEQLERGDLLGQRDRVVLGNEADTSPEP